MGCVSARQQAIKPSSTKIVVKKDPLETSNSQSTSSLKSPSSKTKNQNPKPKTSIQVKLSAIELIRQRIAKRRNKEMVTKMIHKKKSETVANPIKKKRCKVFAKNLKTFIERDSCANTVPSSKMSNSAKSDKSSASKTSAKTLQKCKLDVVEYNSDLSSRHGCRTIEPENEGLNTGFLIETNYDKLRTQTIRNVSPMSLKSEIQNRCDVKQLVTINEMAHLDSFKSDMVLRVYIPLLK
jgi:hypothetical protein